MRNIGVGLHNHTEFSFLDGYSSTDAAAKRASEIGMQALAITDHGEVSGHLAFQRSCEKFGVNPVFGIEGYLVDSIARVRAEQDRQNSHLCMFAKDQQGLKNLWELSSRAYVEGRYRKPLVDWEMLDGRTEGIIATDGCLLAYMARAILADDMDAAARLIGQYVDTFGRENFYMELHTWQFMDPKTEKQHTLNNEMSKVNQGKAYLANKYGIPLIVVNDSHYANECDWHNHALVWDMSTFSDDKTNKKEDQGQTAAWIMDDSEMYFWMERHGIGRSIVEKALHNTAEIASRCSAKIEGRLHLPSLTGTPEGDLKLFEDKIWEGFQKKVVDKGLPTEIYAKRVQEEYDLIVSKKFDGYFNVVADYVGYAKNEKKMLVGPGRGSASGAIIDFLLGITTVDAIKYDLLFSRFLNEARTDMPDIDVDFPQSRRKEITEGYLPMRYGKDNVCLIGTLSRSQPKGISNDLCRAYGIDFGDSKEISKIIDKAYLPQGVDAREAWELIKKQMLSAPNKQENKPLDVWKGKYPHLFQKIDEMVGLVRQSSTHAAGVLISDVPLWGEIPVRIKGSSDDMPITQFENSETKAGSADVAEMGYIKYDFLGLRTLDTLEVAFSLAKERHGLPQETASEFYEEFGDTEYRDPEMWDMIARGDTLGVFQVETSGGTSAAKRMRPRNEVDMADLISVNRPGVIQAGMLDEYFDRRDGIKEAILPHPLMEPITARTYGIVVYQEQALKVFLQIANYTPVEAEKVRKMIGKKLVDKMNEEKPRFIQRCLDNPDFIALLPRGKNAEGVALEIWHNVEATGSYAFNEAHAVAYGIIGCWCAYMKSNYPQEFLTALLRTDPDNIAMYVREIKKRGYKILPPDINDSGEKFTLTDDGIRYGITAVFGVATTAFKEIEAHRPYSSFEDFMGKVSKRACNSRVMENLISIGAFDRFGDRISLMNEFYASRKIKDKVVPDFADEAVIQEVEMRLVGSYIQSDPMDKYAELIEGECVADSAFLDGLQPGDRAYVGGKIIKITNWTTKKGDPMAWITIEWRGELFEITVFPRQFKVYRHWIKDGKPVVVQIEKLEKGSMLQELIRLDTL